MGSWAFDITRAVEKLYREIAVRENTTHLKGLAANRPAAIGGKRWWFDTDDPADPHLYYDEESAWWEVGLVPSFATGFVALQASTPGTQQTGHWNVSGTGVLGGDIDVTGTAYSSASRITHSTTPALTFTRTTGTKTLAISVGASEATYVATDAHLFTANSLSALMLTSTGNARLGLASRATSATDGFAYIAKTTGGAPAGTPTTISGWLPITIDENNNAFYFYSNGSWRTITGGATVPANAGVVYTDGVTLQTESTSEFRWFPVTNSLLISDSSVTTPNSDLSVEKTVASGLVGVRVRNASGTGAAGAYFLAQTAGGAGDPYLWLFASATGWVFGQDQSDSNNLKWVRGDVIGAGTAAAGTCMHLTRSGAPVLTLQDNSTSVIFSADVVSNSGVAACSRYQRTGGGNSWTVGTIGNTGNFHITLSTTGTSGGLLTFTSAGDMSISSSATPTYDFDVVDSKTGDQVIAVRNTRNASGTDDAYFYAEVGGTSAGDPGLIMRIGTAGNGFYAAIDNSDGDDYKIGTGVAVGSSVCLIIKQATGAVALPLQYRATVTNSADFTALNGAFLVMTWNTEIEDVGSLHSTVSNTSRFTIPADGAGNYVISGWACGDSNTTGMRMLAIVKNAVTYLATDGRPAVAAGLGAGNEALDNPLTIDWVGALAAGDYVELWYYQNSGGSRTLDKDFCRFSIHKLS
jgi:hypothetical protein